MRGRLGRGRATGTTGGLDGFVTLATYFPAEKRAVTFCSNGQNYSPHDVLLGALRIYFGEPSHVPIFPASCFVPTPAALNRYAGIYASPQLPGLTIRMTRSGATLQSQATNQPAATLDAVSLGVFRLDQAGSNIRIEFAPTRPSFLLRQGGGSYPFTKE